MTPYGQVPRQARRRHGHGHGHCHKIARSKAATKKTTSSSTLPTDQP